MNQLTQGAIKAIYEDNKDSPASANPVLQIINIKKLTSQNPSTPERFRLVISDGTHFMQAMLGTQMNELINNGAITKYTVIKLVQYICNSVQNRRIVIVLNVEALGTPEEKIGDPVSMEPAPAQTGGSNQDSPQQRPSPVNPTPNQPYPQQPQQQQQPQNFGYGQNNMGQSHPFNGNKPPGPAGAIYPIKGLSPYQNKWTIRVRVTSKSDIRHWHNARGEGKLFSVNLLDESGEIKATAFNDQVDQFYSLFEENKVYYISKAKVTMAKPQFSSIQNEYELSLDHGTEVSLCVDTVDVPKVRYNFVELSKLNDVAKDSTIDVIGVVREAQELSQILSKATQKPVSKRDLTLVDTSEFSVRLTLWGKQAESFDASSTPIIAFKGVRVSDFNGRSLSMYSSSSMMIDPDIPEAHRLRGWYDSMGHSAQFHGYSNSMGGNGAPITAKKDELKNFGQVKDENLGMGDKPDYFLAKGTVVFLKQENLAYPACPSDSCNKKVTEDAGGWRCEKCNRSYDAPEYRYIMAINVSDHTGQVWLQCFNDIGVQVLGKTAGELMQLKDINPAAFSAVFQQANFQQYMFKCRAKQEVFNDTSKVRYSVLQATPLDFVSQSKSLLEQIAQLEK
ncbi:replication factor-a protein [Basidiobolus meristosporus CBS 931.73]|uniref:Replication protein A subunit n=1 Tax=Basidiobolus meristosporus CBS 931.73 TaxID=1314790 RepID=A0A1Y1VSJ5_9FUNG|nr:replication factor-a protein [Basidiobolus meristosporus CBS 931.73]ORX90436.1 replication factor-a protein [Basidiobolus meristosporus CBS 931.73]|eukprot:ORX64153.1 replication factor-a protein [Basidiobolus meristosporus CBS 931.73]